MEVELPSIPQSIRSKYTTSFKAHKAQLDKTKKLIVSPTLHSFCQPSSRYLPSSIQKSAKQSSSRSALLSSSNGSPLDPSLSDNPYSDSPDQSTQRTRLLQGTERLQDGTRRLEESHRLALETENVGGDILSNLRRQREQIEHSRDVLVQADSSIDRASGTLKNMIWRCVFRSSSSLRPLRTWSQALADGLKLTRLSQKWLPWSS
jgi:vesicle transport through interaction with t-SNAREs protein 1